MNGGYCLIDCTGLNTAAEVPTIIPGIYKKFFACMEHNKPILLYNVTDGTGLSTPIYAAATSGEGGILVKSDIFNFIVSDVDDSVTIITDADGGDADGGDADGGDTEQP